MSSDTDVTDAQIAGLVLAVSALIGRLRTSGALSAEEIDRALGDLADDVRGSKLAQATPGENLVAATVAPIEQLRRMNAIFDTETGRFPDWISRSGEAE